jgi:hypothetical protein
VLLLRWGNLFLELFVFVCLRTRIIAGRNRAHSVGAERLRFHSCGAAGIMARRQLIIMRQRAARAAAAAAAAAAAVQPPRRIEKMVQQLHGGFCAACRSPF